MGSKCVDPAYVNLQHKLKDGLKLKSDVECYESKVLGSILEQAQKACEFVKSKEQYSGAKEINLVGVSLGGLMARSILEDCDMQPKVRNILTIGTPNMGVSEVPFLGCNTLQVSKEFNFLCKLDKKSLLKLAFTEQMQKKLAATGFVRDTGNMQQYKEKSNFLADLNNERNVGSGLYEKHKSHFSSVNAAMFVQFTEEEIVFPPISEVFGEIKSESASSHNKLENKMEDTDMYKSDALGLKTLNEQNKIQRVTIKGKHTRYQEEDIEKTFLPFLKK